MTAATHEKWAGRIRAADLLGISSSAMLLLQRDRLMPPDCLTCGRIVWRITDLEARRDEVREYLRNTYPDMVDKLIVSD